MLGLVFAVDAAHACGGFACSLATPVVQNREQVVFGMDPDGEVEMQVQIGYQGPSTDFAWIVPVPEEPELFVGSSALFARIDAATTPGWSLRSAGGGVCDDTVEITQGCGRTLTSFSQGANPPGAIGASTPASSVTVASEAVVGPYETVVLRADDAGVLVDWLSREGYDVPDGLVDVVAPYVADDAWFVALKLTKDSDQGDLQPIGLRYRGTRASIPIRLTSLAVAPELPVDVFVLSDTRAVPESYLHVVLDEAAVDWSRPNPDRVLRRAVAEAGGHAFATEYYGPNEVGSVWDEDQFDEDGARAAANPGEWFAAVQGAILWPTVELYATLEDLFGAPPGIGATLWQCGGCAAGDFDAEAWTDGFVARVADPMRAADDLLGQWPMLTRMTTVLDAGLLDVDPTFVRNESLGDAFVASDHRATVRYDCRRGRHRWEAPRDLELSDGRVVAIGSEESGSGGVVLDGASAALIIEQLGAHGPGTVLVDHRDLRTGVDDDGLLGVACGCGPRTPAGLIALVLAVAAIRRARLADPIGRACSGSVL